MEMPAVVHNLQTRDKELGTYILSSIKVGQGITNNDYETYEISASEVGINAYIGATSQSNLVIPEYINGKKWLQLEIMRLQIMRMVKKNITSIEIPNSIKVIGKKCFLQ